MRVKRSSSWIEHNLLLITMLTGNIGINVISQLNFFNYSIVSMQIAMIGYYIINERMIGKFAHKIGECNSLMLWAFLDCPSTHTPLRHGSHLKLRLVTLTTYMCSSSCLIDILCFALNFEYFHFSLPYFCYHFILNKSNSVFLWKVFLGFCNNFVCAVYQHWPIRGDDLNPKGSTLKSKQPEWNFPILQAYSDDRECELSGKKRVMKWARDAARYLLLHI